MTEPVLDPATAPTTDLVGPVFAADLGLKAGFPLPDPVAWEKDHYSDTLKQCYKKVYYADDAPSTAHKAFCRPDGDDAFQLTLETGLATATDNLLLGGDGKFYTPKERYKVFDGDELDFDGRSHAKRGLKFFGAIPPSSERPRRLSGRKVFLQETILERKLCDGSGPAGAGWGRGRGRWFRRTDHRFVARSAARPHSVANGK